MEYFIAVTISFNYYSTDVLPFTNKVSKHWPKWTIYSLGTQSKLGFLKTKERETQHLAK